MRTQAIWILASIVACALAYTTGLRSVPSKEVTVRYVGAHDTIEIVRGGELMYELEPDDGLLYNELLEVLHPPEKAAPAPAPTGDPQWS